MAALLFLALLLIPAVAVALPGPEVVVPAMLAMSHAVMLASALLRALLPVRARLVLMLALPLLLALWIHPTFALLATWPLWTPRRALPLFAVLAVALLIAMILPGFDEPLPPLPRARGAPPVVHFGEQQDFANCRVEGIGLVRPADLADIEYGPDTLFITGPAAGTLTTLPARGITRPVDADLDALRCYTPRQPKWVRPMMTLWGVYAKINTPLPFQTVYVRPRDRVWLTGLTRLSQRDVLATPTDALERYAGQDVLVCCSSITNRCTSAAYLLERAGARVRGITHGDAVQKPPVSAVPGFALVLGLALILLRGTDRRLYRWRARRAARGREDWPAVQAAVWTVLAIALAYAGAAIGRLQPLPPAMSTLVTPIAWGPHVAPAAALALTVAAAGWAAVTLLAERRARVPLIYIGGLLALLAMVAQQKEWLTSWELLAAGALWVGAALLHRISDDGMRLTERSSVGGKIGGLARLIRDGVRVPPGVVADEPDAAPVSRYLGSVPLIVRSSAPDEDTTQSSAAGRYLSLASDLADVETTIARVRSSYQNKAPALVMPRVPAPRGGVLQVNPEREIALLEEGAGTAAVTAGGSVHRRALDLRCARLPEALRRATRVDAPCYIEYLRGEVTWVVQRRPAPAPFELDEKALDILADLKLPRCDGATPVLARLDTDGLPERCAPATLALWARQWQRSGALGAALPLPRRLIPRRLVVAAWGALWSIEPARQRLEALLWARSRLGGLPEALLRPLHGDPRDLDELARFAIALRFARPLLPAGEPVPTRGAELAAALRSGRLEYFGHRAPYDLDPASPRYGPFGERPRLPPVPARWTRARVDAWRDAIRDRMAWEIARLPASPSYAATYAGHQPELRLLTAEELPSVALRGVTAESDAGVWVSGSGPISGTLTFDPRDAGPDRILAMRQPTPELAARFRDFKAVVAETGGALSHAALVAREDGVPALFGASLAKGLRAVQLTAPGYVVAAGDGTARRPEDD